MAWTHFCPKCRYQEMREVGSYKSGFSAGKAVAGAALFGVAGVAAGALGKNRRLYKCPSCGYEKYV